MLFQNLKHNFPNWHGQNQLETSSNLTYVGHSTLMQFQLFQLARYAIKHISAERERETR